MSKKKKNKGDFIPYQKCPKCNGEGLISRSPWYVTSTVSLTYTCDVCNGAMIIPMYRGSNNKSCGFFRCSDTGLICDNCGQHQCEHYV